MQILEITPEEFFASDNQNPEMLRKMVEDIKTLTPGQIDSLNKTISEFKIANSLKSNPFIYKEAAFSS